jgi:diacylglycerol kinase (ATP)
MADRRAPAVLRSFNYAFEGVIHVLRTQRNMRIHFAIAAAVLVLADRLARPSARLVNSLGDAPINLTVIALILTIIVVIAIKAITGTGTPLRGGLPSGHAALAFGCWAAITFIVTDHRVVISFVALIMALLVSQTRVEAEIHTPYEVVAGAVIGTLVTLILFQVFR